MSMRCAALLLLAAHVPSVVAQEPNSKHRPCGIFARVWEAINFGDCTPYGLFSFKTEEVDTTLTVATRENTPARVPDSLLGLLYMDDNPLADEVVTLAGASCPEDDEDKACYVKVYDERVWSWSDNFNGRLLYSMARQVSLVYKFVFNEAGTFARVTPTSNARVEVPEVFATFDMYVVDDEFGGRWVRNSTLLFGLDHVYQMRRIVDGEGKRTANWDKYYIANIGREDRTLGATQQYAEKI